MGADVFHAVTKTDGRTDGRTDMTKLIVAFRNFANAPKNRQTVEFVSVRNGGT
jgi:hypothetical protein